MTPLPDFSTAAAPGTRQFEVFAIHRGDWPGARWEFARHVVVGNHVVVDEGALLLIGPDGRVTRAWAPRTWSHVTELA